MLKDAITHYTLHSTLTTYTLHPHTRIFGNFIFNIMSINYKNRTFITMLCEGERCAVFTTFILTFKLRVCVRTYACVCLSVYGFSLLFIMGRTYAGKTDNHHTLIHICTQIHITLIEILRVSTIKVLLRVYNM